MIGDMVASRALAPRQRARVQEEFTDLIDDLNRAHASELAAKFVITLGDEFQALFRRGDGLPRLIWKLEQAFTTRRLRLGFGYGLIYTSMGEYAINVDGPALHHARASLENAKHDSLEGGVFTGFGETMDAALNGLARVLHHQRATWPTRQREVVERLSAGCKGVDIARELGISKQAVSRYASLAGWEAYAEGERGWTALLCSLEGAPDTP
jgi:hypothetical protein